MRKFDREIAERIALRILANWGKEEFDLWLNLNNEGIYSTDNDIDFDTYLESGYYKLISSDVYSILEDWGITGKNQPSLDDLTDLVVLHSEYFGCPETFCNEE